MLTVKKFVYISGKKFRAKCNKRFIIYGMYKLPNFSSLTQ